MSQCPEIEKESKNENNDFEFRFNQYSMSQCPEIEKESKNEKNDFEFRFNQ